MDEFSEYLFASAVVKRKCRKAHGAPILGEGASIPVTGHEHDLESVCVFLLQAVVELAQHGCEVAARWAPVSREVNGNKLLARQCLCDIIVYHI